MKKFTLTAIVVVATISGFISYSKATTSSLNALALANVEALSGGESEDKKGEYFRIEHSTEYETTEDLGDRICNIKKMHVVITCPNGGYSACTPGSYDLEMSRDCVEKAKN